MKIDSWEQAYLGWEKNENLIKLKESIKIWGIKEKESILDLCCGSGKCIRLLNREGYLKVFGLDLSKNLLSHSQDLTKIVISDAFSVPFKDNKFDVVLVNKALHHVTDHYNILREVKRILRNQGTFCFIEPEKTWLRLISHYGLFFTPLGYITKNLRFLRKAVKEEKETYYLWLKNIKKFLNLMTDTHSFEILNQRSDKLHLFIKARITK